MVRLLKSSWKCFYCKYLKCVYGGGSGFPLTASPSLRGPILLDAASRRSRGLHFLSGAWGPARVRATGSRVTTPLRPPLRPKITPVPPGGYRFLQAHGDSLAERKSSVTDDPLNGWWTKSPSRPGPRRSRARRRCPLRLEGAEDHGEICRRQTHAHTRTCMSPHTHTT